jgi:hypothetical protein
MECPLWAVRWMEAMDRHYERFAGIIVPPHEWIHECICAYRTDVGLENFLIRREESRRSGLVERWREVPW